LYQKQINEILKNKLLILLNMFSEKTRVAKKLKIFENENNKYYSRHSFVGLPEPKSMLIWYNITISTNKKNNITNYCSNISICKKKIIKNILDDQKNKKELQILNPFFENEIKNNITTSGQTFHHLCIESIVNPFEKDSSEINLKELFNKLHKFFLIVFEKIYPSCISVGLNSFIIKGNECDTDQIFENFVKIGKEEFAFFYTKVDDLIEIKSNPNLDDWLLEEVFH
jgi:hypothetical protein